MSEMPDNTTQDDLSLLEDPSRAGLATESEVTDQDLSTEDLVDNGVPVEDLEQDRVGMRAVELDAQEPGREETIDQRLAQEEPDPTSAIVPPKA